MKLDLELLQKLVDHAGVAVRVGLRLQPAGGAGDKVFPPTYERGEDALKYTAETRRIDGKDVPAVLLNSVVAQANRMEEALLEAWQQSKLDFPVIGVEFLRRFGPARSRLDHLGVSAASDRGRHLARRDEHRRQGVVPRSAGGQGVHGGVVAQRDRGLRAVSRGLELRCVGFDGLKGGLGAKFQRALTSEIGALGWVS